MANYMITARQATNTGFHQDEITTDKQLSYLRVADDAESYTPADRCTTKDDWIAQVIQDARTRKQAAMEAWYRTQQTAPSQADIDERADLLFFLHGYNNNLPTILWRHKALKASLEANGFWGSVVSFDWPCGDKAVMYLSDRSKAHETARFLVVDIFSEIARRFDPQHCQVNIHVLAHSMGSYVLQEAFRYARNVRPDLINNGWQLQQVALVGADLACSDFRRNGDALYFAQSANRVTNYVNPCDSALKASNLKHHLTPLPGELDWSDRIGRKGLPQDTPPSIANCYDVNCKAFYETRVAPDSQPDNVYWNSIGFPPPNRIPDRPNLSHSWHIGNPVFARDLVDTLHGDIDRKAIPTRKVAADGSLSLAV